MLGAPADCAGDSESGEEAGAIEFCVGLCDRPPAGVHSASFDSDASTRVEGQPICRAESGCAAGDATPSSAATTAS